MQRSDHRILSSRARLIEVCIESSFQPLLQLYIVLPTLIHYFECGAFVEFLNKFGETFSTISRLQFWSIITSIVCLSWSFNFYKVTQKCGALDLKANLYGRICLLASTLLQISSRLLAFVLLAYTFGPGEFWPMMVLLHLHIVLMAFLHHFYSPSMETKNVDTKTRKKSQKVITKVRLWHHCLLNGIGNIYIHNCITYMDHKTERERKKSRHRGKDMPGGRHRGKYMPGARRRGTDIPGGVENAWRMQESTKTSFYRQVTFNAIFVMENLAIFSWVYTQISDLVPFPLLLFIPLGHLFGVLLNVVYYRFYHLWKDSLKMKI